MSKSTVILAGHEGKEPIEMLAFVNGALQGIVAFAPMPERTKRVITELQQRVDKYINK